MTPRLIQHYLHLCHHYRRALIKGIALSVGGVAVLSYLLLLARPSYTATATMVVLPTEAQMGFAQQAAFGYDSTSALSGTLLEYLVSRPVLDSVLDQLKMGQQIGIEEEPETLPEHIAELVKGLKKGLKKAFRIFDSGMYVEGDPRLSALDRLADGIELAYIPGTLVIELEVTLANPEDAKTAANALAQAYLDRETLALKQTASEIESFLDREISERESLLASLKQEELAARRELGLESLEGERSSMQSARETERQNLADARTRRIAMEARHESLLAERRNARSGEALARLDQEISATRSNLDALEREETVRQQTLDSISEQLDSLHEREQPINDILERAAIVESDLSEFHDEMLEVYLTRIATANQVRIINPAIEPLYPSSPRVVVNMFLGTFAAVFLALVIMIASDTFSGTIKTQEDLRALGDTRCVGSIAAKAASWPDSTKPRTQKKWRKLREDLLGRLALFGMLDQERIRLTGFVAGDDLEAYCELLEQTVGRTTGEPAEAEEPRERSTSSSIDCLHPVGEGFRWSRVATGDSVLCVIPAGAVSEDEVLGFAEQVAARGANASFLLIRS